MHANYPLIIVRKEDLQYFETLKAAQLGDEHPFIRFIAQSIDQTIDFYQWVINKESS
jgi:hypothetical protein